jgi:hypothetical protein
MKPNVNIIAVVDVIGALSSLTLDNGNLCLADDGAFDSGGQGTPELCTVVAPGQVVQWSAVAVDVQTPIEIQSITFIGDAASAPAPAPAEQPAASENPDANVWTGVFPAGLTPGVPYKYRLTLKMHEGPHSVLSINTPALMSV